MNKSYKWLVLVGVVLGFCLFGCQQTTDKVETKSEHSSSKNQPDAIETYRATVAKFTPVSATDFQALVKEKQVIYAYFGRETCEHCRRFAPELARQAEIADVEILYLNTENSEDLALKALRKTYQVEYVPTLLRLSEGTYQTYQADKDPLAKFLKPQ